MRQYEQDIKKDADFTILVPNQAVIPHLISNKQCLWSV